MTDVFIIAGVVLLAVLVGFAVPALMQFKRTMKAAEEFLESTGSRLNRRLDEAAGVTQSVERVSAQLEGIAEHLRRLTGGLGAFGDSMGHVGHSVGRVGDTIGRVNETVRQFPGILGALASAAMAGVRAATRANRNGPRNEHDDEIFGEQGFQRAGRSMSGEPEW